jgi:hypothetical protein
MGGMISSHAIRKSTIRSVLVSAGFIRDTSRIALVKRSLRIIRSARAIDGKEI